MSHKYYHNIEENLRNNKNNLDYILNNLITSFSLYFLSDHFIGNELERFNVPVNPKSNNILKNDNIDAMKEMQILFVHLVIIILNPIIQMRLLLWRKKLRNKVFLKNYFIF